MQQGLSVSILLFMVYLTTLLTALTIQFAAVIQLTNSESECTQNEALVASFEALSWLTTVSIEEKYGIFSHDTRLPG
jgi:hypothetical protein